MNIQCEEWCHQKVVECIEQINEYQETLNYKPTKLQFKEVTIETPGYFNHSESEKSDMCESTLTADAMIENYVDMENLIKKNFMMQSDKKEQFAVNNPVQMTLREEIEIIYSELNKLKEQNQQLANQFYDNKDDSKGAENQAQQIEKLERQLNIMDIELAEKKKSIKNWEAKNQQLRAQLRDAEDKNNKYENFYIPKLKETKKFQREIFDELEKIRQDAELLPSMFRAEAIFTKKCKAEKEEAQQKMNAALKQHNKLVSERDDLKHELERKQRMAMQAIAARGNMKSHLDEAKKQYEDAQKFIEKLKIDIIHGENEIKKYKMKHDEMFSSVSGLNARIEELEQHKYHLLEKLKSYVSQN